jgi:hypothetical protein
MELMKVSTKCSVGPPEWKTFKIPENFDSKLARCDRGIHRRSDCLASVVAFTITLGAMSIIIQIQAPIAYQFVNK